MRTISAVFGCLLVAAEWPALLRDEESMWRKLPPLPGRTDYIGPIALEGDTLWATGGNSLSFWTGSAWRIPEGPLLKGGQYLTKFIGGGNQPLLYTQPTATDHVGELYRLHDGRVTLLTTFHYDSAGNAPPLRLAPSGLIHSTTSQGIRVFHKAEWHTTPRLEKLSALFETPDAVFFYDADARQMVSFDAEAGFRRYAVELELD